MTARKPLIRTVSGAGLTEVQLSSSDLSDGPFAGTSNFTSVAAGLAPASGGGTTNFLRADGTWAAPAGSSVGTITYTGAGGAYAQTLQAYFDGQFVDVRAFTGFDATGATDSTAAVTAAVTQAASGTVKRVFIPPGARYNAVVKDNNITIFSSSGNAIVTASGTTHRPWDITKPVLQVGDDTGNVYGVHIMDMSFEGIVSGGQGAYGLVLGGGAQQMCGYNIESNHFTSHAFKAGPATDYPIQYNHFYHTTLSMNQIGACTAALGLYNGSGSSWVSAIYFHGLDIQGSNYAGHAIELDSVGLYMLGGWIQTHSGHCINMLNNYSNAPRLVGYGNVEVAGGTDAIDVYNNNPWITLWLTGDITFTDGSQIKTLDGNLHNFNQGSALWWNAECRHFHNLDEFYLSSSSAADPTETTKYLIGAGNNVDLVNNVNGSIANRTRIDNAGTFQHIAYGGIVFAVSSVATSSNANYVRLKNTAAGDARVTADGASANIDLSLEPKGTGVVKTSAALTAASVNAITGLSNATPAADSGAGAAGTATTAARGDHIHPGGGGSGANQRVLTADLTVPNGYSYMVVGPFDTNGYVLEVYNTARVGVE